MEGGVGLLVGVVKNGSHFPSKNGSLRSCPDVKHGRFSGALRAPLLSMCGRSFKWFFCEELLKDARFRVSNEELRHTLVRAKLQRRLPS